MFGNISALAMEPLGEMAGIGAALVGALTTLISLPIAWFIGYSFNGGVFSLVFAYALTGIISLVIILWADSPNDKIETIR